MSWCISSNGSCSPERFILCYVLGLALGEYSNNPFEQIAYALEDRFSDQGTDFSVEPLVKEHLGRTVPALLNPTSN